MTPLCRAVVLSVLIAGCSSPGELVQRHAPGTPVGTQTVTVPGSYGLFVAGDAEPLLRFPLQAGDRLGFESGTQPATVQLQINWLYGIAGSARGRLDAGKTYEWRRLPDQR
jgi:hypothetical protein